jgi:hypothetical protein
MRAVVRRGIGLQSDCLGYPEHSHGMVSNLSICGSSELHVLIGTHFIRSESLVWFVGSWDGTP